MRLLSIFLFLPLIPSPGFTEESPKVRISRDDLLSKFEKEEEVQGVIVDGEDLIDIIFATNYDINIKDAVIVNGLDFTKHALHNMVGNRIQIIHSEIQSIPENSHSLITDNIEFNKEISFQETVFNGDVDFSLCTFKRFASFNSSSFKGFSTFIGTIFGGDANFREVLFDGDSGFNSAIFKGGADFSLTIFKGDADFELSSFFDRADFDRTIFNSLAYFKKSVFKQRLSFRSAQIKGYGDFRETTIGELDWDSSQSSTAVLVGRIDFRKAIIRDSHIQDIIFEADVDFSDTILLSSFVLRDVVFGGSVYFLRTNFSYQSALENVRFKSEADFTDASFRITHKFALSYVRFNDLKITWAQLPGIHLWLNDSEEKVTSFIDLEKEEEEEIAPSKIGRIEPLSQALSGLETNFRNQNLLDDANEAYYHSKKIELDVVRQDKALQGDPLQQVFGLVWWGTSGFGMRIYWIILWCFGINLFFTLIYARGDLKPSQNPDDAFRLRLFDFPINYSSEPVLENPQHSLSNFFNIFWFSAVILMKIGVRNKTISGKMMGINYKYIVLVEWLVGLYFLAALSVTLTNTVPIVNRLVTGIF